MEQDYKKLLKAAYIEAQKSTNPSTQNGAVLVNDKGVILISAANTFPDGVVETTKRKKEKTLRYRFSVHAERNVIYQAAKAGIKTKGLIMACPWAACGDCAQAIIQAGIKRLVTHKQAYDRSGTWLEEVEFGFDMLREAEVEVIIYDGKINAGKILRHETYWET